MNRKLKWRYYCGFCRKSGMSASHISRHENFCTMNPVRICRMCEFAKARQQPIESLIGSLKIGLDECKKVSKNCPACIFAALRQSGTSIIESGFDFNAACKQFFREANERDARQDEYHAIYG